jgi:hypothetical protein
MPVSRIWKDDWKDYEERKSSEGNNQQEFDCTAQWEMEYLSKKIKDRYSHYSDTDINNAISICCKNAKAPIPRKDFVNCVMIRLRGL